MGERVGLAKEPDQLWVYWVYKTNTIYVYPCSSPMLCSVKTTTQFDVLLVYTTASISVYDGHQQFCWLLKPMEALASNSTDQIFSANVKFFLLNCVCVCVSVQHFCFQDISKQILVIFLLSKNSICSQFPAFWLRNSKALKSLTGAWLPPHLLFAISLH